MADDKLSESGRFQVRLQESVIGFIWKYFWRVASFVGGAFCAYFVLLWQTHTANSTAELALKAEGDTAVAVAELRSELDKLVTVDKLDAALAPRDVKIGELKQWQKDLCIRSQSLGPHGRRSTKPNGSDC